VWVLIVQGTDVTSLGHRGGRGGVDPDNIYISGLGSEFFDLVKSEAKQIVTQNR
jgi:hypothetical protein